MNMLAFRQPVFQRTLNIYLLYFFSCLLPINLVNKVDYYLSHRISLCLHFCVCLMLRFIRAISCFFFYQKW